MNYSKLLNAVTTAMGVRIRVSGLKGKAAIAEVTDPGNNSVDVESAAVSSLIDRAVDAVVAFDGDERLSGSQRTAVDRLAELLDAITYGDLECGRRDAAEEAARRRGFEIGD